jgi:hypothetical protein
MTRARASARYRLEYYNRGLRLSAPAAGVNLRNVVFYWSLTMRKKNLAAAMLTQMLPIFAVGVGFAAYKADPDFVRTKALLQSAGVDVDSFGKSKVQTLGATYDGLGAAIRK